MTECKREVATDPMSVPASMVAAVDGFAWAQNNVGESGGSVYRLHDKGSAPDLYLKHGRDEVTDDLIGELVRLHWLASHIAVPSVQQFASGDGEAWLLMSAVPGKTAYQILETEPEQAGSVVDSLARFLRKFHAIPVADCPFNSDHHFRLAQAKRRMESGLVDADDFDDERAGWTAQKVWHEMTKLLPFAPDPVVTHGDFSLDNLLMQDGDVVGCIDVGRVGIADRYQDLAILWNCLGEFSSELQTQMFASYGVGEPDVRKLRFHLMLDEFF